MENAPGAATQWRFMQTTEVQSRRERVMRGAARRDAGGVRNAARAVEARHAR